MTALEKDPEKEEAMVPETDLGTEHRLDQETVQGKDLGKDQETVQEWRALGSVQVMALG